MFVKIIRNSPKSVVQEIYEPTHMEFRRLDSSIEYQPGSKEELMLYYDFGHNQQLILFSGDEVWLTSDSGQTVDRWKI